MESKRHARVTSAYRAPVGSWQVSTGMQIRRNSGQGKLNLSERVMICVDVGAQARTPCLHTSANTTASNLQHGISANTDAL
jgi:hypothetical protein